MITFFIPSEPSPFITQSTAKGLANSSNILNTALCNKEWHSFMLLVKKEKKNKNLR